MYEAKLTAKGSKTEYRHSSVRMDSPGYKHCRAKAHQHAAYLRALGHQRVRVTRRMEDYTIPGRGIGLSITYTTHHGV